MYQGTQAVDHSICEIDYFMYFQTYWHYMIRCMNKSEKSNGILK